jgi:cytidine deaminase
MFSGRTGLRDRPALLTLVSLGRFATGFLMDDQQLIDTAQALAGRFAPSEDCCAGTVAAALITAAGHVFSGVCVDTACSLGFCAEHAAVAEMLKARESEVRTIVAVNEDGRVVAPCGRCRELLWQVNPGNRSARILLGGGKFARLSELLPMPTLRAES